MAVYLVERSLEGITMDQLGAAQKSAIEAGKRMTAGGKKVRYVRSTFVPGEGDRVAWRGLNTAEELAHSLAGPWKLPVEPLLERVRSARPQRGLPRKARAANVRGSFRARGRVPAVVALVDDVYTTGATATAAARELKRLGARSVHVVAFARAIRG